MLIAQWTYKNKIMCYSQKKLCTSTTKSVKKSIDWKYYYSLTSLKLIESFLKVQLLSIEITQEWTSNGKWLCVLMAFFRDC